ncbi:MAG: prepilin-type N-terminal cleavage/methylation domain-containing protein [Candidatus Thioglobus sp.]|jgi:type IV pilus assembly protein PilE
MRQVFCQSKARCKAGFTLIELLIVIAILGIIAGIGVPMYNGYIQSSKESVAKNSLKSICLIEADYHTENSKYFTTSTGNQTKLINTTLFNGRKTLNESGDYYYFIRPYSSTGYRAYAYPKNRGSSLEKYCVDHNDNLRTSC